MFDSHFFAFISIAGLLTITPGSDTMLVVRNALVRGRRAGLLTVLGVCSGLFIHAALSALGFSMILVRSAKAFEIMKWIGVGYLIFLGAQSIRSAVRGVVPTERPVGKTVAHRAFVEGLLNNVLNPKVAVFYLAFLPQFIGPKDSVLMKSILLAAVNFTEGVIWLSMITLFVARLRPLLTQPRVQRCLEGLAGLVLIGFGLRLAMERR